MTGFVLALFAEVALTLQALHGIDVPLTDSGAFIFLNLMTYTALGFGYFGFVNLNLASLRIRILKEFVRLNRDVLRPEELLADYNADVIVTLRLKRLITWKQVLERNGRLYSRKAHFLALARAVDLMKRVVYGRS